MPYSRMDPEAVRTVYEYYFRIRESQIQSVRPLPQIPPCLQYSVHPVPLSTALRLPIVRVHISSTRCQIFGSKPRPKQCVHKYLYPPALWPPSNGYVYVRINVCPFVIGIVSIVKGYTSREVSTSTMHSITSDKINTGARCNFQRDFIWSLV